MEEIMKMPKKCKKTNMHVFKIVSEIRKLLLKKIKGMKKLGKSQLY
jgi:hypothetical protein